MSARPTTDRRPPTTDDREYHSSLVTRHSSLVTPARLLAIGVAGYIVVFTLAAWYKYATYQMGFDLGVHQQVLWNTAHGRLAATSAFADTESYLGIDIIPTELLLAPLYALAPSVYTMLLVQTLALALGAIPVFLLVRDRFRGLGVGGWGMAEDLRSPTPNPQPLTPGWAGLVFAAAYLLYLPVEYMNLYEFQIRAFATTFLLLALLALERRRFGPFLLWTLLALGCRSDVGFVVAGMGFAQLRMNNVELRKKATEGSTHSSFFILHSSFLKFTLLPIVLGLGWLALCVGVLIPLFRTSPFLYTQIIYGQFGDSLGEIARTLVTRPGYVAAYVFGGAAGAARLRYLLEMFLPFAFLLLLRPRMLLITLPIFALNLLSNTPNIHASTHYHYQALIIPFMVVGSAEGLLWLLRRTTNDQRPTTNDQRPTINSENCELRTANCELRTPDSGLRTTDYATRWSLVGIVILALACNLYFRNPFFSLLTRPVDQARIAATERLLERVPPDAALATTSAIGPHVSRREWTFFFPGNVIYPEAKIAQAQFLLIDHVELLQDERTRPERQRLLADLSTTGRLPSLAPDATYRRLAEEQGVSLWERVGP